MTLCGAAAAHPHIFVQTGLVLKTDQFGQLTDIEVTWAYDELYTLLILEDFGLDPDFDGILTPRELAELQGFDLNWAADFAGDLYVLSNGVPVKLGRPTAKGVTVTNGQLISVHSRAIDPEPRGEVIIKAYDPTFYTAYDLGGGVRVDGPCHIDLVAADLDAAYDAVGAMLKNLPADQPDGTYPEVGEAFADEVRLVCEP